MEKTKLWSTGLSAVLLSTTLLSGIASANTGTTSTATPTKDSSSTSTTVDSQAKKDLLSMVGRAEGTLALEGTIEATKVLQDELKASKDLLAKKEVTDAEYTAQFDKLKAANTAFTNSVSVQKTTSVKALETQLAAYDALDTKGASTTTISRLKAVKSEAASVLIDRAAVASKINAVATKLETAIATFKTEQAADIAYANGKTLLKDALATAKTVQDKIATNKVAADLVSTLNTAVTNGQTVYEAKDSKTSDYNTAKTVVETAVEKVNKEITDKEAYIATMNTTVASGKAYVTASKPTKLVDALNSKVSTLEKVIGANKEYTLSGLQSAVSAVNEAIAALDKAGSVYKISTGTDGKLTVNFSTKEGQTIFPSGTNRTTKTGTAYALEKDTYIELKTVKELVDDYKLKIPAGFELAEPNKEVKSDADVTNLVLVQSKDAKFAQSYVTFKFTFNGEPVATAGDYGSFTSLQDTDKVIAAVDVLREIKNTDTTAYKELQKHFYKSGYTTSLTSKQFKFETGNFYQEATIDFVKKPKVTYVPRPKVATFNKYPFAAGKAYSLTGQLELYLENQSNLILNNKDYKFEIKKVVQNSTGKVVKKVNGKYTLPKANTNYKVSFIVRPKTGAKFEGTKSTYVSMYAYAYPVDTAPEFKNIKTETFKVGKFKSYKTDGKGKAITAYDYQDKKNITVTYKGKVKPKTPGTYKVYYYAKDSKGNVAKKTRYVKVVK